MTTWRQGNHPSICLRDTGKPRKPVSRWPVAGPHAYHMPKESGHRECNEKRGTKEGKGIFLVLGSIGSSVVTKYCGKKANKLVKCRVIGEVEREVYVTLVTTVKMESSIEVETCINP